MPGKFNWLKWRILVITLPFTILFCAAKWTIHRLGWEIWSFDTLTSSLFAAATFITAFILSGTLGDYRESEGLPGQICATVESIYDCSLLASKSHPEYDPKPLLQTLVQVLQQIYDWLLKEGSPDPILETIADFNSDLAALEPFSNGPLLSRVQGEQGKLRALVVRIQVIRETHFVASAYAILDLFTAGAALSLLLIANENFSKTLALAGFLFTAFVYLQLLIRDLDNPFEYKGNSCADVSLSVLENTLSRLQRRLVSL